VIPTPVLAQVHRGGRDRAHVDRVVKAVGALLPTSEAVARRAGELQARAGTSDAIDGIVAAEALMAAPALILASDEDDLRRLVEGEPEASRVLAIGVQAPFRCRCFAPGAVAPSRSSSGHDRQD
jgi:hypothetical protein